MAFIKRYLLGWFLGPALACYGLVAMLMGRAFLPGLHGNGLTLGGRGGFAMAAAYLSGGIFLFLRMVLEKHENYEKWQSVIYMAENLLLLVFIGSLVYVLVSADTVQ